MLTRNEPAHAIALSADKRWLTALFAAAFGAFLLYGAAFSHSDIVHNAAHDVRHAITAPCH